MFSESGFQPSLPTSPDSQLADIINNAELQNSLDWFIGDQRGPHHKDRLHQYWLGDLVSVFISNFMFIQEKIGGFLSVLLDAIQFN